MILAQAQGQAPGRIVFPNVEYSALLPMLVLVVGALVLLTVSSLLGRRSRPGTHAWFTIALGLGSLGCATWLWHKVSDDGAYTAVAHAVVIDGFSVFFMVLISATVVLGALLGDAYLRREDLEGPEFYVLMMLSASGGMLMAAADDLIVLFLGLEILSIALYVLAGYHGRRVQSREAALKYFVLGAFSSAIFLYGIALVYGATGSTNLPEIGRFLARNAVAGNGVLLAGMGLLLVGLGFKVAAVPFHAWTPDVYQGAPTPVTGFMAAAAKAAGFAGLLRVFFSAFATQRLDWRPAVFALAVVTLLVGSVLAVVQTDIKRMLAYSSISHAGYVLIGLQAASRDGVAGSLFYLLAYTFMVLGSFAVVTVVGRKGDARHNLEDYRGLASRRPGLALAFSVFLMAQAGVPFTSGFLAKFYVISAAVDAESYALAIIGMLAAAIAAFFYLRVILIMYSPVEDETGARIPVPFSTGTALALTLAFTLVVGILPAPVMDFARHATLLF
jgi:NADH-quinone oxidoreductase subunit N